MSRKSEHIAELIQEFSGEDLEAYYLGYFACFNRQQFYEAHDVLEELWLKDQRGANGDFYKGLIQIAGAFVHVQKGRIGPALALLRLARTNLDKYPSIHRRLNLTAVLCSLEDWSRQLERPQLDAARLLVEIAPKLALVESAGPAV